MKPNILSLVFVTAAVMSASAQTPAAKTGLTKTDLRKLFADTEWLAGEKEHHLFFHRDGKITGTGISGRFYAVEAPDILKIYDTDPKKDRKAEFYQLRVNVAAMLAEPDGQGSTKPGAAKSMKYAGPAKTAK